MLLKSVLALGVLAGSADLQLAKAGGIVDLGPVSPARMVSQLLAQGITVHEIRFADDRYVMQAFASGQWATLYVIPGTWQVVPASDADE